MRLFSRVSGLRNVEESFFFRRSSAGSFPRCGFTGMRPPGFYRLPPSRPFAVRHLGEAFFVTTL
ncbi:MAG: hypothetical protein DBX55_00575 [Verrucomicrobia bacterium]|nr:MAG: hypothetical protein DBX55_00575 [Verrucomicrobiota bacterium]